MFKPSNNILHHSVCKGYFIIGFRITIIGKKMPYADEMGLLIIGYCLNLLINWGGVAGVIDSGSESQVQNPIKIVTFTYV